MTSTGQRRWLRLVMLAAAVYLLAGVGFGALAAGAPSQQVRVGWRLAAWLVSGVAFAGQIAYECLRDRDAARAAAWHAALGAALGAFALAAAANIHEIGTAAAYRPRMAVALVAWPVLTFVPAFLVALAAAAGLIRIRRQP